MGPVFSRVYLLGTSFGFGCSFSRGRFLEGVMLVRFLRCVLLVMILRFGSIFCVCFLVLRWAPVDIVTFLKGSVLVSNVLLI